MIRVARELFALLPVNAVVITAVGNLLNTSTGHLEEQPSLSVAIPKRTLEGLNLGLVDPSDCLRSFVHREDFKKTKGFLPVERLRPGELKLTD